MLDLIRKKQKSVLIQIVFWAIIATFVGTIFLVWGKGGDDRGSNASYAAKVNGSVISIAEYQNAYGNLYRLYQNVYRDQFTPQVEKQLKLRQQAYDLLVDQTLLLQEADRRDLSVSKKELVDAIAKIPAFQENGVFSKERYLQALRGERLTSDAFEAQQMRQLLVEKVRETIRGGVSVTDADIDAEQRERNEKVSLQLLRFTPAIFENRVRIDSTALQNYFKEHAEAFRLPERIAVDYVILDPTQYRKDVVLNDDDLERYYRRHLDRFEIPESVHAAHILIRVPAGADAATKAAKRTVAEKLLVEIKAGKDFAVLARTASQDPGSAANGGDLGTFQRGMMVPPFEQAAFALKAGQVSDIVETSFGFHIIKVIAHQEAEVKPLAAVIGEVKNGLTNEQAAQLALEKALDLYNINRKGGSLDAAAKSIGLTIRTTPLFSREAASEPFTQNNELLGNAFALSQGELGRPVLLPQGALLYSVAKKEASRLAELGEVRSAVETAYRKAEAGNLARAAAETAAAELRKGGNPRQIAARSGANFDESGLFTRSKSNFIPKAGVSEALMNAAFALDAKSPVAPEVYEIDGNFLVAVLKEHQVAPPATDPAVREELRKAVLSRKQDEAVDALLKDLKAKAVIEQSPSLVATLEG